VFLQQTPIGAATFALLPAIPAAALGTAGPSAVMQKLPVPAPGRSAKKPPGSMVVHVTDAVTGEMTLFAGTREIALRDPRLIAHFVAAAG